MMLRPCSAISKASLLVGHGNADGLIYDGGDGGVMVEVGIENSDDPARGGEEVEFEWRPRESGRRGDSDGEGEGEGEASGG
jgi:hypothetical protein